jgi:hypothetical protein
MVMNGPTFATWLYGPMGVGVLGGVEVSTMGDIPSSLGEMGALFVAEPL